MSKFLDKVLVPWTASRVERVEGNEYLPRVGPALIVPNHISYFDPIILYGYLAKLTGRKTHFLSLTAYWKFPGANTIARWIQPAFLDKRRPAAALDIMKRFLERGEMCAIYPEGSRNPGPELLKGKTGAARLALWTHVPVIPAGIIGPATRSATVAWKKFLLNEKFRIRFGKPLDFSPYHNQPITKDLLYSATRVIMKAVGSLCEKSYLF